MVFMCRARIYVYSLYTHNTYIYIDKCVCVWEKKREKWIVMFSITAEIRSFRNNRDHLLRA